MDKFCECEVITSVARDMKSTCMQCGGTDAYKKSPLRNKGKQEPSIPVSDIRAFMEGYQKHLEGQFPIGIGDVPYKDLEDFINQYENK